jgi:hypothetical protein
MGINDDMYESDELAGVNALEKKTGWSQSGKLRVGSSGNPVTLQAIFKKPGPYTVQIAIPNPFFTSAGMAFASKATATLIWTVEGNQIVRQVSVGNGVSVQGVGEGVTVIVNDTTDGTAKAVPGIDYDVSISVAYGTRATTQQPPQFDVFDPATGGAFVIAPGGSAFVRIPQNIGVISVLVTAGFPSGTNGVIPPNDVQVVHSGVVIQKSYDPRILTTFVPVGPGTNLITVNNLNGAQTYDVSITFGIDG